MPYHSFRQKPGWWFTPGFQSVWVLTIFLNISLYRTPIGAYLEVSIINSKIKIYRPDFMKNVKFSLFFDIPVHFIRTCHNVEISFTLIASDPWIGNIYKRRWLNLEKIATGRKNDFFQFFIFSLHLISSMHNFFVITLFSYLSRFGRL